MMAVTKYVCRESILLSMLSFMLLSMNNTRSLHGALQPEIIYQQDMPARQPSVLSVLLDLYETLPVASSTELPPPFREVSYAFLRQRESPSNHVTLATQTTVSTLPRLLQLLERWGGPISCAVHLPDPSAIQTLYDFVQKQNKTFHELVAFHVMLEKPSSAFGYPINRMRNLALKNIDTEYFFICNVDFLPRKNAHSRLLKFLSTKSVAKDKFRKLYVLPAFEFHNSKGTRLQNVPKSKLQLLSMLSSRKLQPFHMNSNVTGHQWRKCADTGQAYPIDYRSMFEPYVVGAQYGIPTFNEQLRGFGMNETAWVLEAHLMGYQFEVLCDQFVVRMDHLGDRGNSRDKKTSDKVVSKDVPTWSLQPDNKKVLGSG
jgi:glycosyltransferase-like protein LARGE